jgi:succinate-acetate transporter protein
MGGLEAAFEQGHFPRMVKDNRIIEMTIDGEFVSPPKPPKLPLGTRVMLWAIVATVISAAVLIVAITFWFVLLILPVLFIAAAVAYLAYRFQFWRAGRTFTIRRGPGGW